MHSSTQLLCLALLPLAINALPQPQDAYDDSSSGSGSGSWDAPGASPPADSWGGSGAGGDTWGAAASPDTWGASPTPDTWAASPSPAAEWAATAAVAAASGAAQSVYDPNGWSTQVTWPAGCQTWANPCPSGAVVSGGGDAAPVSSAGESAGAEAGASSPAYTNGFTSYLTMTNSDGIATGMPSVATSQPPIPGVSGSEPPPPTTASPSSGFGIPGTNTTNSPSVTQSGFSQETVAQSNDASGMHASVLICTLAGVIALLL